MDDYEVVCPSCGDPILLPRGDSNVFECPECSAGIDWNGKHIVGLRTDRSYMFPGSSEYETFFDADYLHEAVKFANDVMDNDASTEGLLGSGGGNEVVTIEDIQADFEFDRNVTGFAILSFIPAIFVAVAILSEPDGLIGAICCLGFPTLFLMFALAPSGYRQEDAVLATKEGGSYAKGRGSGLTPDGRFLAGYEWKNDTFKFSKFKKISPKHRIEARSFYHSGGEYSSPSQGYSLSYFIGGELVARDTIITKCHDYSREKFLSDLNQILSFKNKLKRKTGFSFEIRIVFDFFSKPTLSFRKSRNKKSEIADWINNDPEISSVWNKITGG